MLAYAITFRSDLRGVFVLPDRYFSIGELLSVSLSLYL